MSNVEKADMRPMYKWLLWILGTLLVLLIIAQIIISLFADDYVAGRLKKSVHQGSDSTYTLTFNDLDLNIFGGSVSIQKAQIEADTSAFTAQKPHPPKTLYKGTIGELKVSGIHVLSALWGDKLSIGSIIIKKPNITAIKNPHPVPPDTGKHFSSVDSSIYAAITPRYKSLTVDHFIIKKARLRQIRSQDTLSSVKSLGIKLQNIHVDSASAQSKRIFVTRDMSMHARHFMMKTSNNLNTIALGKFAVSSNKKHISLDSLQINPRYPRYKFSQKHGTQIDRIDLTISHIDLRKVDFTALVDSAHFHSALVKVKKGKVRDFHSKAVPRGQKPKKAMPNVALLNMKHKIKIDTIRIQNSYVSYSEFDPPAPKAGLVSFQNLNATITNVTNYRQAIENGEDATMHAKARVFGKGALDVHFTFPLDTHNGFHKIHGTLSRMKFTTFNRMLKYVAFAKADRGILNHLQFNMTLNNDQSSGSLIMNYENLKASVLKKKSLKQKGIVKNLESFAANTFIIKENNTPESGMQSGKIQFKRIKTKGVFNFWWKSLFSGMKNSIKK